jgi:excisionase family DNA binding protein
MSKANSPTGFKPLLTRQQVAEHLRISVKSVDRAIANAELATVRIGRMVRIRSEDLEFYVTQRRYN